jgi:hypothetical protein
MGLLMVICKCREWDGLFCHFFHCSVPAGFGANVFMTALALGGSPANAVVSAGTINGAACTPGPYSAAPATYGIQDLKTSASGTYLSMFRHGFPRFIHMNEIPIICKNRQIMHGNTPNSIPQTFNCL